jgi:hypothetical protein
MEVLVNPAMRLKIWGHPAALAPKREAVVLEILTQTPAETILANQDKFIPEVLVSPAMHLKIWGRPAARAPRREVVVLEIVRQIKRVTILAN